MDVRVEKEKENLKITVIGKVDTGTAPAFDRAVEENAEGVTSLILDLGQMPYTSSAGLRVVLKAQKMMNARGGLMKVVNVQPDVLEIFGITGFTDFLTIE